MSTIKGIGPHNYKARRQKAVSFKMTTQDTRSTTRHKKILLSRRKYWGKKLVL
jgi:hypothetical protein